MRSQLAPFSGSGTTLPSRPQLDPVHSQETDRLSGRNSVNVSCCSCSQPLLARTHRSRHCSDSVRYLRYFCRADEASGKLLTQFHRSLLQCSSDSGPTTVGRGMANQTWTSDSASLHHGRIPAVSRPWLTRSRYEAFHGKLKRMSVIVRSGKVAVKSARVWRASSMRPART